MRCRNDRTNASQAAHLLRFYNHLEARQGAAKDSEYVFLKKRTFDWRQEKVLFLVRDMDKAAYLIMYDLLYEIINPPIQCF